MDSKRIGENVKRARLDSGMSQEELARALGLSVFTISRLERGVPKGLNVHKLYAVAAAIGVSPEDLLEAA